MSRTVYVGGESGDVTSLALPNATPTVRQVVRTRDGSAVKCLLVIDLLDVNGSSGLAVGSAQGTVGYYHGNGRTAVCEHELPFAVAALAHHRTANGAPTVAASDIGGTVLVFGLLEPLWRLRLQDVPTLASRVRHPAAAALLSLRTCDEAGVRRRRLLLAGGGQVLLQVGSDGSAVSVHDAPTSVTALATDDVAQDGGGCDGATPCRATVGDATAANDPAPVEGSVPLRLLKRQRLDSAVDLAVEDPCRPDGSEEADLGSLVLLACSDGTVRNFPDMSCASNIGVHVTSLDARQWRTRGLLVCCGRFDGVIVAMRAGGVAQHVHTSSGWALGACILTSTARDDDDGHLQLCTVVAEQLEPPEFAVEKPAVMLTPLLVHGI